MSKRRIPHYPCELKRPREKVCSQRKVANKQTNKQKKRCQRGCTCLRCLWGRRTCRCVGPRVAPQTSVHWHGRCVGLRDWQCCLHDTRLYCTPRLPWCAWWCRPCAAAAGTGNVEGGYAHRCGRGRGWVPGQSKEKNEYIRNISDHGRSPPYIRQWCLLLQRQG